MKCEKEYAWSNFLSLKKVKYGLQSKRDLVMYNPIQGDRRTVYSLQCRQNKEACLLLDDMYPDNS